MDHQLTDSRSNRRAWREVPAREYFGSKLLQKLRRGRQCYLLAISDKNKPLVLYQLERHQIGGYSIRQKNEIHLMVRYGSDSIGESWMR
jgi:hypothetical protein